jgi:uncharacterized Zn-binding protein involved in type VI secretion
MPAAARRGDPGVVHCSGYVIASGSPDVFINNRSAARVGDPSTTHLVPGAPCFPHVSKIAAGSPNVFVNNLPLARQGDPLTACTKIAQGSPDVFANG